MSDSRLTNEMNNPIWHGKICPIMVVASYMGFNIWSMSEGTGYKTWLPVKIKGYETWKVLSGKTVEDVVKRIVVGHAHNPRSGTPGKMATGEENRYKLP